jgi:hypothetical protein
LVVGLSGTKGQLLFDRLIGAWASVSMPLGTSGCRANFFVIVSTHPEADLKAWWGNRVLRFAESRAERSFIETPRPVRIWYNTGLIDSYGGSGATTVMVGNTFGSTPVFRGADLPLLQFSELPDLSSVIAVVDFNRVVGLDLGQLADYIAMMGLTELKPDADIGELPSILRLFTTSGDARPQGLTAWDRTFIRELYATDTMYRGQRIEIAQRMYRDLAAP